jgi:tripartite ATP-independent transporter DctM subunit
MSELAILLLLFVGVLLILYAIGIPVAFAMGITIIVVMLSPFGDGLSFALISNQLLFSVNNFAFLAVPFYLFLGRIMNRSGMTSDIFDFAQSLVGKFEGGLAYVNILASMIFAGISGAAVADAAGLGRIEYNAMRERGYSEKISIGVTGSSSIIGPIIPPSIMIIVYGLLTGESISALFLAGVLPGILLGLMLMIFTYVLLQYHSQSFNIEEEENYSNNHRLRLFVSALPSLLIPVIIIGGIYSGFFTPTEAGAIAVIYTIGIGFLFGDLTLPTLFEEMRDSSIETFAILFIVALASLYGQLALRAGLPMELVDGLTNISSDPTIVLLLIAITFIIIGTFMEGIAALTIMIPILTPIVTVLEINTVHLGMVSILSIYMGALTPPLGIVLFVLDQVTDADLITIIKGIIPYYIPILITIFVLIFVPDIILYIPENFG